MISSLSRSYWFGASDASKVLTSNQKSYSWCKWWEEKTGGEHSGFSNVYTRAGTMYEHPILETIGLDEVDMDRQIYIPELRMRINLDGDKDGIIYEVKTHKPDKTFEITDSIYAQCQVQMFAYQNCKENELPDFQGLRVVSCPILDYDEVYINPKLIKIHKVKYSRGFMRRYMKKHMILLKRLLAEER